VDRTVLQRIADHQHQTRAAIRRACPGGCLTAADDGVTHAAGARLVDSVTGQIVEVVSARQFPNVTDAP